MDAELRDRLKRQGVEATAYVWPSKMSIYASMVPQYNTEFLRAGEQAMSASGALEQGDKRFASFRGLPVYETEAFGTCLSWVCHAVVVACTLRVTDFCFVCCLQTLIFLARTGLTP